MLQNLQIKIAAGIFLCLLLLHGVLAYLVLPRFISFYAHYEDLSSVIMIILSELKYVVPILFVGGLLYYFFGPTKKLKMWVFYGGCLLLLISLGSFSFQMGNPTLL